MIDNTLVYCVFSWLSEHQKIKKVRSRRRRKKMVIMQHTGGDSKGHIIESGRMPILIRTRREKPSISLFYFLAVSSFFWMLLKEEK